MKGNLNCIAIRVPTSNVSLVDLVFNTEKDISVEAINNALVEAADGELQGILGYSTEPLVSIDYVGNQNSSTVDLELTQTMGPRMGKILTWYDNEWGFSNRMVQLTKKLASFGE